MPITLPVAMLIAQGVTTGAQVYANRSANKSQERAYNSQQQAEKYALDEQLRLERERMAEERRRYDEEAKAKEAEAEARKPYENMRMAALAAMAKMQGIDLPPEFLAGMMGGGRGQQVQKPIATAGDIRMERPIVDAPATAAGGSLLDAARGAMPAGAGAGLTTLPFRGSTPRLQPIGTAIGSSNPMDFLAAVKKAQEMEQVYKGYFGGAR